MAAQFEADARQNALTAIGFLTDFVSSGSGQSLDLAAASVATAQSRDPNSPGLRRFPAVALRAIALRALALRGVFV